jgi:hypothetical protein
MKIDDFLKKEMNWTDRDLEYRPVIGYLKVTELLQKWGEKQLLLHNVVGRSEQLKAFFQEIENDKTYILNDYYKNKAKRLRESL